MVRLRPTFCLLIACCVSLNLGSPIAINEDEWWKNAIFYQIYPRSFKDNSNDGVGDLLGVIEKLDHLVDAGVTALWLSPIFKSPQVDFGYDISDFRDIWETFGNMSIFKNLVKASHEKGLKVILDFVPNHSSDEHEWFQKSIDRVKGYENFYVWVDGSPDKPPNGWISNFHGPAWTFNTVRNQWYLHQFASGQPDLNYRDPAVVQEMKDVLTFWLDLDVDGFRVDIISALFEDPELRDGPLPHQEYKMDQPETYDMVYQWRILLDDYQKKHGGDVRVMMTESYSDVDKLFPYYGNGTHKGAHFTFNFWFITQLNRNSNAHDFKGIIDKWFQYMNKNDVANWVLGNHDQHRVASRYGPERVDGLNMIAMLLPGVTVSYNGEEIGMENGWVSWEEGFDPQGCNGKKEDWEKNSRDFERTPFHWDDTVNAGFNDGHKTWLPIADNYKEVNLAKQKTDNVRSHYRVYQELTKMKKLDTIKYGDLTTSAVEDNVLVIVRTLQNNPTIVVIVNTNGDSKNINLEEISSVSDSLTVKLHSTKSSKNIGDKLSKSSISIAAYEALVLSS